MRRHVEKPRHYGKLAKIGLVWGFVREGGNSLLMLPTAMILARLLTPQEAGIVAAANFFTQLCARLTHVGLRASLVRAKEITPAHAYYIGFLLFSPFREVREIVHESAFDFVPAVAKRLPWLTPREKDAPAVTVP